LIKIQPKLKQTKQSLQRYNAIFHTFSHTHTL